MSSYKSIGSSLPPLIADFESALTSTVSNPSNHATLESRGEALFDAGNMKIMALPGISDGTPIASAAEVVAGTTRLLVRVNMRELVKAAKNGDAAKVRSLAEKANALIAKLYAQVSELNAQ